MKRAKRLRGNWLLFCAAFMFVVSTAFWAASVANFLFRIRAHFIFQSLVLKDSPNVAFLNAAMLVNYIIADGVVVTRAWTLCREESPRLVYIPVASLVLTTFSVTGTISLRMVISRILHDHSTRQLSLAINCAQIASLVLSLMTNASATGLIALKAWRHRKAVAELLRDAATIRVKGETILAHLVESGFLYCLVGLLVLVSANLRLPYGTVGQLAGIYPTMVLVVISLRMTISETTTHGFRGAESFARHFSLPVVSQTGHSLSPTTPDRRV